jgi:hypothetical protein
MPIFYRVVRSDPATVADFTAPLAQGRILRDPDPERQRLWSGVSANATAAQATARARDYPALGRYIARLVIPETAAIRAERTLPRSRGHYTLWGDPAALLACVSEVVLVEAARSRL